MFDFLGRADDKALVTMAVTIWHLWDARNAVRNDEQMKHPHSLAKQIKAYIDMIQLHLFKQTTNQKRETTPSTPVWSPPSEGTAVVNVDAALFFASSRMGVGVVIRYHNGDFLAAYSQVHEVHDQIMTPEIAEAHAVRCAVALARGEGLDKVILVSDCLSVIQRINAPGRDRSLIGVVIEDIKTLSRMFSSVTFRHVSRLCNNSAHILARRAELFGSV